MGLFITCDEATTICDKSQYGEATFFEKIKLQLHFIKCKICALYTKQNNLMTKICDQQFKKDAKKKEQTLSLQEKEKLKKLLQKNKV